MRRFPLGRWMVKVALILAALLVVAPVADAQRQKRTTKSAQTSKAKKGNTGKARSMESVRKDKNTTQRRISEAGTVLRKPPPRSRPMKRN